MKRVLLLICLVAFCSVAAIAGAADKVVVVPLSSAKTIVDPNNIVSFSVSVPADQVVTVFTVPADRKFMLTDIVGQGTVVVKENDTNVMYAYLYDLNTTSNTRTQQSINYSAGIPFGSGSAVKLGEFGSQQAYITISGYYFK